MSTEKEQPAEVKVISIKDATELPSSQFTGIAKYNNGTVNHFLNGKLHRMDGPAVVGVNKEWWLHGYMLTEYTHQRGIEHYKTHPDIPFVHLQSQIPEDYTGLIALSHGGWICHFKNGKKHRLDGPACRSKDGTTEFWIDNHRFSENEWRAKVKDYMTQTLVSTKSNGDELAKLYIKDASVLPVNYTGIAFFSNGITATYLQGKLHRENGSASIDCNTFQEKYYLLGKEFTKSEFEALERVSSDYTKLIENKFTGLVYHTEKKELAQFRKGKFHSENTDEPAILKLNSEQNEYWVNGIQYSAAHEMASAIEQFKKEPAIPLIFNYNQIPKNFTGKIKLSWCEWICSLKDRKKHNLHGPACTNNVGNIEYWIEDKHYPTKELWEKAVEEYKKRTGTITLTSGNWASVPQEYTGKIEWADGDFSWYKDGKKHREDGPAHIKPSGYTEWAIEGVVCHSKKDWENALVEYNKKKMVVQEFPILHVKLLTEVPKDFIGIVRMIDSGSVYFYPHKSGMPILQERMDKSPVNETLLVMKTFLEKNHPEWLTIELEAGSSIRKNYTGRVVWLDKEPSLITTVGVYHEGELHSLEGPALFHLSEQNIGELCYYINGIYYSESAYITKLQELNVVDKLPADRSNFTGIVRDAIGDVWYYKGHIHREGNLPAHTITREDGNQSKFYHRFGKYHREDGPAIEYSSGSYQYFLNDICYDTKEKYEVKLKELGLPGSIPKVNEPPTEKEEIVLKIHSLGQLPHNFTGKVDVKGDFFWYKNGLRHRNGDLPAVVCKDGYQAWYKNNLLHRENNLPARTWTQHPEDGEYYVSDQRHRLDGPAINHDYYINGTPYTKEEFNKHPLVINYKKTQEENTNMIRFSDNTPQTMKPFLKLDTGDSVPSNYTGVVLWNNGSKSYHKNGQKHNLNGPAHLTVNGIETYYLEGKELSKDEFEVQKAFLNPPPGITLEMAKNARVRRTIYEIMKQESGLFHIIEGSPKNWWVFIEEGNYHRLDGPAVINPNGKNSYCINGSPLSENEFNNHPLVKAFNDQKLMKKHLVPGITEDMLKTASILNSSFDINKNSNGLFCVMNGHPNNRWIFVKNGLWHNLEGPAYLDSKGIKTYSVDGYQYNDEEQYNKDPQVIAFKNKKLLKENQAPGITDEMMDEARVVEDAKYLFDESNSSFLKKTLNGLYFVKKDEQTGTSNYWLFIKDGQFHREDGPAYLDKSGKTVYWLNGIGYATKEEFEKNPKVIEIQNKKLMEKNLVDGIILEMTKETKVVQNRSEIPDNANGLFFVENGIPSSYWVFIKNGKWHREDGPAYISVTNKTSSYWLNGHCWGSKEEFKKALLKNKVKDILTVNELNLTWVVSNNPESNFTGIQINLEGDVRFFKNGKLHRDNNLPAVILSNGYKSWYVDNQQHNTTGPARIYPDGSKEWWVNGMPYSEEQFKTFLKMNDSDQEKSLKEKLLKFGIITPEENLQQGFQALELLSLDTIPENYTGVVVRNKGFANETVKFYQNGIYHRTNNLPTVIHADGTKEWWVNGLRHREDGPAIEHADGTKEWVIANQVVTPLFFGVYKRVKDTLKNSKYAIEFVTTGEKLKDIQVRNSSGKLLPVITVKFGERLPNGYTGIVHFLKGNGGFYCTAYYENGEKHREDGPAVTYSGGKVEYWVNGEEIKKEVFETLTNSRKDLSSPQKEEIESLSIKQEKEQPQKEERENTTMSNSPTEKPTTRMQKVKQTLGPEAKEAAKRVAVNKSADFLKGQMIALFTRGKKGRDLSAAKSNAEKFLTSEAGKVLLLAAAGGLLPAFQEYLPEKVQPVVGVIASECRIQAMGIVGNEAVEFITGPVFQNLQLITSAMSESFGEDDTTRVDLSSASSSNTEPQQVVNFSTTKTMSSAG